VQLAALRPDLRIEPLRGNLDTRLRKLDQGDYDAIVLAAAGLVRLGAEGRIRARFATPAMLPCARRGALGVGTRSDARAVRARPGARRARPRPGARPPRGRGRAVPRRRGTPRRDSGRAVSAARRARGLVTRPAAQAGMWVEQLRARGINAEALPLIEIAALDD